MSRLDSTPLRASRMLVTPLAESAASVAWSRGPSQLHTACGRACGPARSLWTTSHRYDMPSQRRQARRGSRLTAPAPRWVVRVSCAGMQIPRPDISPSRTFALFRTSAPPENHHRGHLIIRIGVRIIGVRLRLVVISV